MDITSLIRYHVIILLLLLCLLSIPYYSALNLFQTLLIGLGGGQLATFFHRHFPRLDMDVVEIDTAMLAVAKNQFALKTDSRLRSHVADG